MLSKKLIAAGWLTAALAAFLALPAFAQAQKAAGIVPVCVNCHESAEQHDPADRARGVERRQRQRVPGLPRRRDAAPEGPDEEQARERARLQDRDRGGEVGGLPHVPQRPAPARELVDRQAPQGRRDAASTATRSTARSRASNNKQIKGAQFAAAPYTTTDRQLTYKRCITCHTDVRGEILKPSHHPIIEGKIGCQDCHDPHGSLQKASLRNDSLNDLCTTCHADKRGPWIHEHPPVEENCAICHTPHGSSHRPLLAQKPPVLCGDCHANGHTHGIYDGRGTLPNTLPSNIRFESSGCVECHRQIHGSNAPSSAFGQYFMR